MMTRVLALAAALLLIVTPGGYRPWFGLTSFDDAVRAAELNVAPLRRARGESRRPVRSSLNGASPIEPIAGQLPSNSTTHSQQSPSAPLQTESAATPGPIDTANELQPIADPSINEAVLDEPAPLAQPLAETESAENLAEQPVPIDQQPSANGPPARLGRTIRSELSQTLPAVSEDSDEPGHVPRMMAATPATAPEHGDVILRWTTPQEVSVGQQAHCELQVSNTGRIAVHDVTVRATLSEHTTLDSARPPAKQLQRQLAWQLGNIEAGQTRTIEMELTPNAEGELEPSATVTFTRISSARIQVLKPSIALEIAGPPQLISGQIATVEFIVSNPGNGRAQNVLLEARLGEQLKHPEGAQLSYSLGTLGPGESRTVQVPITGGEAGNWPLAAVVLATGNLKSEQRHEIEVIRPHLELSIEGPRLRYVDRQAMYTVRVHNPGPAPANNVQLFDTIPPGLRFIEATSGGTFDSSSRQVAWFVGRLEPNTTAEVGVQLIATETGEQQIAAAAKADAGVSEEAQVVTQVEGISAVVLNVVDSDDPVEINGETDYEIRATNNGSHPATNVQIAAKLPKQMRALDATGPTTGQIDGQQVIFAPLESLGPGQTETYHVRVSCQAAGQVGFRAYFRTDDHGQAVMEEELTRIYQD